MPAYKYSRWDGTQQIFDIDENALLESMSEDILAHGDVDRARRAAELLGRRAQRPLACTSLGVLSVEDMC